jgi:hypothetical protein
MYYNDKDDRFSKFIHTLKKVTTIPNNDAGSIGLAGFLTTVVSDGKFIL